MDYKTDFDDGKTGTSLGALHYKHHKGTGKTLIFLHGLGAGTLVWKRTVEKLPKELDVYLIDLLGHGLSDAPQIEYTVKNQVESLWELFEAQNLEDFYLIGNSYGGWIAAYYASKYAVAGLVLEDAAGLKESFDQIVAADRVDEYKKTLLKLAMETAGNREYVIKSILDSDFREDELDDYVLSQITEPTLIIWGANDLMLSPKMAELLHSKIRNSKVKIIEGAGHEPHFTNADEFVGLLLSFIGGT